jgi:hypothetical protein
MEAHGRPDPRPRLRLRDSPPVAGRIGPDRHGGNQSGVAEPGEHGIEVGGETVVVEVAVGIDEWGDGRPPAGATGAAGEPFPYHTPRAQAIGIPANEFAWIGRLVI